MLHDAKRLAKHGAALHWLRPESKAPVDSKWSTAPVNSVEDLEDTYRKGYNLGLRPGKPSKVSGRRYLYWIDVDIKGTAEDADEAYAWLDEHIPGWKKLPWIKSGSAYDSFHMVCVYDGDLPSKKLAQSTRKIEITDADGKKHKVRAWEIERFGTGKQVAIPPSIHPDTGNAYEWKREIDWDDLDAIYLDLENIGPSTDERREGSERSAARTDSSRSLVEAVRRKPLDLSRKKIKKILEGLPDDWCFNRDEWLKVGMALHHQFEGSDDGLKLWHWFSEADDKYWEGDGPGGLDYRWDGFGRGDYGNVKPTTFRTLIKYSEVEHDEDDSADDDDEVDAAIKRLNKKHAMIRNNGKTLILNEESDGRLTWSRDRDFMNWYNDDRIEIWGPPDKEGKSKLVPISVGKLWWNSDKKRKYEGVTMKPEGDAGNLYNLWRGFSVEPDEEASCDLFLDHIFDNVCNGDRDLYDWIIGWMAHMIQRPWEKPGVALVFKGKRGVGKTIIGEVLERLLREHTVKVSAAKHLTGNFNAHLSHAVFVRVEEAFWVGDKSGAQVLKDMVTGLTIRIEQKGVDSGEIPSFHRFVFTSNEQWVIPAGMEERRFCVVAVQDYKMQNRKYFGKLLDQLKDGGYGALLHFLQNVDISNIDVGKAPVTDALGEQKLASLSGIEAWWAECLSEGQPPASRLYFNEEGDDWNDTSLTLPSHEIRENYEKWLKARKFQGDPLGAPLFTKRLLEMCPLIHVSRPRGKNARVKCLVLPPLDVVRAEFEKHFGQVVFARDDE